MNIQIFPVTENEAIKNEGNCKWTRIPNRAYLTTLSSDAENRKKIEFLPKSQQMKKYKRVRLYIILLFSKPKKKLIWGLP